MPSLSNPVRNWFSLSLVVLAVSATPALAAAAPEFDPGSATTVVGFVVATLLTLTSRFTRRS